MRVNASASLQAALAAQLGGQWRVRALGMSALTATWRAEAGGHPPLFIKAVPIDRAEVLEAEADGLRALAATQTIAVPQVAACWRDASAAQALLALEWLLLVAPTADFGARFGSALAALHDTPAPEGAGRFGWTRDNMLGGTPQRNRWSTQGGVAGWVEFFGRERLGALRDRLTAQGAGAAFTDDIENVIEALPGFFDDGHQPQPSLVHGDLWSGNWGQREDGTPVIYDPAVACADAECELAMMELFGSPPEGFWPAYRARRALHAGYERRRGLYQLYHLLNHALMFGGGYAGQASQLMRGLVARR